MGWRGCKCGQYIPQSQGLVHVMSSTSEIKYMVFLPSHCTHQSQVFLWANLSWPFILKKSSSVSHLLNSSCAFCTSSFSVCLNTPNFLFHPCLASSALSPFIGFPLLPAQWGAKAGELLQKVCSKQAKFQTLPRESVHSITPSFVQHACRDTVFGKELRDTAVLLVEGEMQSVLSPWCSDQEQI